MATELCGARHPLLKRGRKHITCELAVDHEGAHEAPDTGSEIPDAQHVWASVPDPPTDDATGDVAGLADE